MCTVMEFCVDTMTCMACGRKILEVNGSQKLTDRLKSPLISEKLRGYIVGFHGTVLLPIVLSAV